ncbi:MAG: hypothetical protein JWR59_215 [Brevundimonas sp.]|nr:hypothetical protein [Brevundimonas sp.]
MTTTLDAIPALRPEIIGRYIVNGQTHFLPFSALEMVRATEMYGNILDTFNFAPGRQILMIALFEEGVQFAPFEEAVMERGLLGCNADASPFEATRIESILRRFDVAAVAGVNGPVLDGLEEAGFDLNVLFKDKVVWARPDAYARLQTVNGVRLRRWIDVGPTVALECAEGDGAYIDSREWQVDVVDGEILLTNRLERCLPLIKAPTGVKAHVDRQPGSSGLADVRITPDA